MKKICIYMDSIYSLGGIERVVTSLCNKLISDYDITIVCQYNAKNKVNYNLNNKIKVVIIDNSLLYIDKIIFFPIRTIRFLISKFKIKNVFTNKVMNFDYKVFKKHRLINFFNNQKFDYILSEGLNNNIYLSKIKNRINSPIIGCWHSNYDNYFDGSHEVKDILSSMTKLDKTIVLSKHDAAQVKKYYNIDVNQIYNFISNDQVDKSSLKNRTFLAVGRYDKIKGYDRLIKLFNDFYKTNNDWNLLIVGEGSERHNLQKIIDDLNLNNCVKLTGKTNDVEKYYKDASIFLMTSYGEGFPMVIVEAMKYGLPVVAYDIPVLHEMLPNDDFIISQDDSKKFVNAMIELVEDEKLRNQIGIINSKKCKDFYEDKIIKQWKEILK